MFLGIRIITNLFICLVRSSFPPSMQKTNYVIAIWAVTLPNYISTGHGTDSSFPLAVAVSQTLHLELIKKTVMVLTVPVRSTCYDATGNPRTWRGYDNKPSKSSLPAQSYNRVLTICNALSSSPHYTLTIQRA